MYYYSIIAFILVINVLLMLVLSDGSVRYSYEMATVVMIFVFGLCTFTENFKILLQNGVSRKSFFVSRVLVMLATMLVATAMEQVLYFLGQLITAKVPDFQLMSMFDDGISKRGFGDVVMAFGLYTAAYSMGCLINLVYYRLSKLGKVLVSVGVPAFAFIVLPILDSMVFHGALFSAIVEFFKVIFASGISLGLTLAIVTVVGMALSWLLMRRAIVKDK